MMFKNKKGGPQEIILAGVMLFIIGIVAILMATVYNNYYDTQYNSTSSNTTKSLLANTKTVLPAYDTFMLITAFILIVALIAGAVLLRDQPFFFPLAIILLLFGVISLPIIANTFESVATSPSVNSTTQSLFPKTTNIFMNLPVIMLFVAVIMIICLYGVYKFL